MKLVKTEIENATTHVWGTKNIFVILLLVVPTAVLSSVIGDIISAVLLRMLGL